MFLQFIQYSLISFKLKILLNYFKILRERKENITEERLHKNIYRRKVTEEYIEKIK